MSIPAIIRQAQRRAESAGSPYVTLDHLTPDQVDELAAATLALLRKRPGMPSPEKAGWTRVAASQAGVLPAWAAADDIPETERKRLRPLRKEIYDLLEERGLIRKPPGQGSAIDVSPDEDGQPTIPVSKAQKVTPETLGAWLLKADPEVWDIERWISEGAADIDDWSVQHNYRSRMMENGQLVFLWVSGQGKKLAPGIWGVGHVTGRSDWGIPDGYWLDEEAAARAEYFAKVRISLMDQPLERAVLKAHPLLGHIEVFRQPNGSNPSYLTIDETDALLELLDGVPDPPGPAPEEITVDENGAGFGDPVKNRVVELAAMREVIRHLEAEGWDWDDVSLNKVGWDVTASKGSVSRHIEVKGVSGPIPTVLLTRNEYDKAQADPDWCLMVVTNALNKPLLHEYDAHTAVAAAAPYVYRVPLGYPHA